MCDTMPHGAWHEACKGCVCAYAYMGLQGRTCVPSNICANHSGLH